jgi:hypothetical protein
MNEHVLLYSVVAPEKVDENDSEYVAGDDHVSNVLSKKEDTVIFEHSNLQPLKTNLRGTNPEDSCMCCRKHGDRGR